MRFDTPSREFLTGFKKRKDERRKKAQEKQKQEVREKRAELRKEKKAVCFFM